MESNGDFRTIDLFVGPGGLSEGFSSATRPSEFKIDLSVQMEPGVFSTLQLWSFLRSLDLRARDDYFRLPKAVKQVSVKEAIGDLPKLRSGRAAQFAYICVSDLHHWRQAASP